VDYVGSAHAAGDDEAAKTGAGVLAFGFWDRVQRRVGMKVPSRDVDDVAMNVMESAIKSSFDGKAIGQFGAWVNTITNRRIADYHRDREGKQPTLLDEEHEGAEGIWGEGGAQEPETDLVGYRDAAQRVLADRNDLHQRVIRLYGPGALGFLDLGAAEVCGEIAGNPGEQMNEPNVHQIWRRFKKDLEIALENGGSSDG